MTTPKTPKTTNKTTPAKKENSNTPSKSSTDQITKKLAQVNIDDVIDKRLKDEKPIVSVVVVGHVDAGKSTLVAQEIIFIYMYII